MLRGSRQLVTDCYEKVGLVASYDVDNLLRGSWRRRQHVREEVTRHWSQWNLAFTVQQHDPDCIVITVCTTCYWFDAHETSLFLFFSKSTGLHKTHVILPQK